MGLFDFFRRRRPASPSDLPDPAKVSRIDYLLAVMHDQLEKPKAAFNNRNYLGLVEDQLAGSNVDMGLFNLAWQVKDAFELANLYWGQGNGERAEFYLRLTLERHARQCAAYASLARPMPEYRELAFAKCAAVLLGEELACLPQGEPLEPGYEPWFKNALMDHCLRPRPFDLEAWRKSEEAWTRRRFPKYRLEEFGFYLKALSGQFADTDAMLAAHTKLVASRARRTPDAELTDGYADNDLIIDHLFAAVLKAVGWEGEYRHAWPRTAPVGAPPLTTRLPDRFLAVASIPSPAPDAETGIFTDANAAVRFIGLHLRDQVDEEGKRLDASRPAKQQAKVDRALKALGWTCDAATLDLMRAWRMDCVLNDGTALDLCDPVGSGSALLGNWTLQNWTRHLAGEFGLHPDFIAIAASEEPSDCMDPQGRWYVVWKQDGRVYAVDREEWDRPDVATREARPGLTMWPSYPAFVAWWVAENQRARG